MSEERDDLVLEMLRAFRGVVAGLKTAMFEVKEQLGYLEGQ